MQLLEALSQHHETDYKNLYKQALRMVGSIEGADDVVQEAFANTAAAINRGSAIKSLDGWLRRCVYNGSISYSEKKKLAQPLLENFDLADPYSLPEVVYARQRSNKDMSLAIEGLAPDQRRAFLLAEIKGLRHGEVADIMERSKNSVQQLLTRARKKIREAVGSNTPPLAAPVVERSFLHDRVDAGVLRDFVASRIARFQEVTTLVTQRSADLSAQSAAALLTGAIIVTVLGATGADEASVHPVNAPAFTTIQQPVAPHKQGEVVSYSGDLSARAPIGHSDAGIAPDDDSIDTVAGNRRDASTNARSSNDSLGPPEDSAGGGNADTAGGAGLGDGCEEGEVRQKDGTCSVDGDTDSGEGQPPGTADDPCMLEALEAPCELDQPLMITGLPEFNDPGSRCQDIDLMSMTGKCPEEEQPDAPPESDDDDSVACVDAKSGEPPMDPCSSDSPLGGGRSIGQNRGNAERAQTLRTEDGF